jgi:hypothetical protein
MDVFRLHITRKRTLVFALPSLRWWVVNVTYPTVPCNNLIQNHLSRTSIMNSFRQKEDGRGLDFVSSLELLLLKLYDSFRKSFTCERCASNSVGMET